MSTFASLPFLPVNLHALSVATARAFSSADPFPFLLPSVWVSASDSIYQSRFAKGLALIPGIDATHVLESGVSGFRSVVTAEQLPAVVDAAVKGLFDVFIAVAVLAAAGTLAVFGIEWMKIEDARE